MRSSSSSMWHPSSICSATRGAIPAEPLPPARDLEAGKPVRRHALARNVQRAVLQQAPRALRTPLPRAVRLEARGRRGVHHRARPLPTAKSGSRGPLRGGRGLAVVDLPGNHRPSPWFLDPAAKWTSSALGTRTRRGCRTERSQRISTRTASRALRRACARDRAGRDLGGSDGERSLSAMATASRRLRRTSVRAEPKSGDGSMITTWGQAPPSRGRAPPPGSRTDRTGSDPSCSARPRSIRHEPARDALPGQLALASSPRRSCSSTATIAATTSGSKCVPAPSLQLGDRFGVPLGPS